MLQASAVIQAEDMDWRTGVIGTNSEYLAICNWRIARGRAIYAGEVDGSVKVVLLGATVVEKLWGQNFDGRPRDPDPRQPFRRGRCAGAQGQSPMGQGYDNTALVLYDVPDQGR